MNELMIQQFSFPRISAEAASVIENIGGGLFTCTQVAYVPAAQWAKIRLIQRRNKRLTGQKRGGFSRIFVR